MIVQVEKIINDVKSLPRDQFDEFLSWLAEYELANMDTWDKEIEQDSQPGGRLDSILSRVRSDISTKRIKPLNEILNNS